MADPCCLMGVGVYWIVLVGDFIGVGSHVQSSIEDRKTNKQTYLHLLKQFSGSLGLRVGEGWKPGGQTAWITIGECVLCRSVHWLVELMLILHSLSTVASSPTR